MAKQAHICVVGSSNIDLTFRTARFPRPGETLAGSGFHLGHGGKGANQAVAAARLGASVSIVTRVGRDLFGEQLLANFRVHGIDTSHVVMDQERPSGVASIVVDEQARNCILVVPGANGALSPEDVRAAAEAIRVADLLLCQLEVPLETVREAFLLARDAGVRTLLNPAPATALSDDLLRLTDLCVPNETELELLTGLPVSSAAEVATSARALRERGPRLVIVTLGERGALVLDDQASDIYPAVPVDAVDTSGAGDAFIGGLALFLAQQVALPEAVRLANAVAAIAVTAVGTQTALPTRPEVDAVLACRGPQTA
jgi:ribokinase